MKIDWNEQQMVVVRNILIKGWPALSRGDRSIIAQSLKEPDSIVATVDATPHALFWEDMIALGWARSVDPDWNEAGDLKIFTFTQDGFASFPAFINRFDLHSCVVLEEQREIRSMLQKHVSGVAAELAQVKWTSLANRLPVKEVATMPNKWDYYIGAVWSANMLKEHEDAIEIEIEGFLHPSHHKPIVTDSVILWRQCWLARLFGR